MLTAYKFRLYPQ